MTASNSRLTTKLAALIATGAAAAVVAFTMGIPSSPASPAPPSVIVGNTSANPVPITASEALPTQGSNQTASNIVILTCYTNSGQTVGGVSCTAGGSGTPYVVPATKHLIITDVHWSAYWNPSTECASPPGSLWNVVVVADSGDVRGYSTVDASSAAVGGTLHLGTGLPVSPNTSVQSVVEAFPYNACANIGTGNLVYRTVLLGYLVPN